MKKLYDESELKSYEDQLKNLNNLFSLVKIGLAEKISEISDKIADIDDCDKKAELAESLQDYAEAVSYLKYQIKTTKRYYNQALKEVKEKI